MAPFVYSRFAATHALFGDTCGTRSLGAVSSKRHLAILADTLHARAPSGDSRDQSSRIMPARMRHLAIHAAHGLGYVGSKRRLAFLAGSRRSRAPFGDSRGQFSLHSHVKVVHTRRQPHFCIVFARFLHAAHALCRCSITMF